MTKQTRRSAPHNDASTPAANAKPDGRGQGAIRVYEALRQGGYYPWDWQPLQKASDRYMRNHMDLNVLEETKRYPRGE